MKPCRNTPVNNCSGTYGKMWFMITGRQNPKGPPRVWLEQARELGRWKDRFLQMQSLYYLKACFREDRWTGKVAKLDLRMCSLREVRGTGLNANNCAMVSDEDLRFNIWISFGLKDKPRKLYDLEDIGQQLDHCFRIFMDKARYCVEYVGHSGLISLGWLITKTVDNKWDIFHLYLTQKQERQEIVSTCTWQ